MSDFLTGYLSERKGFVERHLFTTLPEVGSRPEKLTEAMHHAVLAGGKRLRPILCLAAAEAAGGAFTDALCPASAIELLHAYTLVHDDLPCMDNDLLRRGLPTVHAKYGEATAVLTGDALLTLAFEVLAQTIQKREGTLAQLTRELAVAAGAKGVIAGQIEDLADGGTPTRAQMEYIFERKTAALFKAACRMGVIAVDGKREVLEALGSYGANLGFAFQVIDDLLDQDDSADEEQVGFSCLAVMTPQEACALAAEYTRRAVQSLENLPGNSEPLKLLAESLLKRVV